MSSSPAHNLQQRSPKENSKRNLESCHDCRNDKKSCHFSDKPWDKEEQGPPCDRCAKKERKCSGPISILRKRKQPLLNQDVSIEKRARNEATETEAEVTQVPITEAQVRDQLKSGRVHHAPRPMAAGWGVADATRSDASSDHLLNQLGNIIATREIVRSCHITSDNVEQWSAGGRNVTRQVKAELLKLEGALTKLFNNTWNSACSPAVIAEASDLYPDNLEPLHYRFHHPAQPAITTSHNDDNAKGLKRLREERFTRKRKSGSYSHADHLCHNICNISHTSGAVQHIAIGQDLLNSLLKATSAVAQIIEQVTIGDDYHTLLPSATDARPGLNKVASFPFCFMALLQADEDVLLDWWRQDSKTLFEVDALGRTPMHSAAYFGRVSALERILAESKDKKFISQFKKDVFGFFPHMIAACKDDIESFKLLLQYGANIHEPDDNWRTCLDLAVLNGSVKVVAFMLSNGSGYATCCNPIVSAIERKRFDVVTIFIDHYTTRSHHDPSHLIDAANLARNYGRIDISDVLREAYDRQLLPLNAALQTLADVPYNSQNIEQSVIEPWPPAEFDMSCILDRTPHTTAGSRQETTRALTGSFEGIRQYPQPEGSYNSYLAVPPYQRHRTQRPTGLLRPHDAG
ncbi:hypothetical protein H2198_003908 [Neophaeococcomyces mojaviensis]|uniref:Uncharacterized protein n=1 Tax=Neophaeococcomyces mojaviensis TaxID=3383035 RepID=A0ACC3AA30_9EURO|nr:hypothetical protein H2198_003908 [Knufia sp. JES_112]